VKPFDLDVLWIRLEAMVDEQALGLQRTAFSHMVREAGDLSIGIFDTRGRLTVQAKTGTPGHIFALPATVRVALETYPLASLVPGDVLITNDPYIGCGHQFDFTVITPVFGASGPVALYASTCHVVDVGGRHASADGSDVYEEGVRLPLTKLYHAGVLNAELVAILRANVRSPDEVVGDIEALVGANEIGGERLLDYMAELGQEDFDSVAEEILARSERSMRAAIAAVPDGVYSAETGSDGVAGDGDIRIAVRIEVRGDEIVVDYDGSSGPSPKGINVVFNYTLAYTVFSLKCALSPDTPNNAGSMRPITVRRPRRSLLNAQEPAPVTMRHVIGHSIPGAIFRALAEAVPARVTAEGSGAAWVTSVLQPGSAGRPAVTSWISAGGMGARPTKDGLSCTSFPTGTSAVSIEILEAPGTLVFRSREIAIDSGGPGRFRGGCGQLLTFEIAGDNGGSVSSSTDRIRVPARGLAGGVAGQAGDFAANGRSLVPKGSNPIEPHELVSLRLPGGAGFGDPLERPPECVLSDVVAGYVSPGAAARDYGVVLAAGESTVDADATARLRSREQGVHAAT
jgi:N-methylhydantoinase B